MEKIKLEDIKCWKCNHTYKANKKNFKEAKTHTTVSNGGPIGIIGSSSHTWYEYVFVCPKCGSTKGKRLDLSDLVKNMLE